MDWLSLFLLIMLGAIAYMQTIHGFVSAAIMAILSLICAALAFATYEYVGLSFLIGPLGDLALPVAFAGMFAIPLLALRLLLDKYVTRSSLLPVWIDKSLAVAAGAVSGYTVTGMFAITILMLPFGGNFLGHDAIDEDSGEANSLWLGPEYFTVTYASLMSDGLFSGARSFSEIHPDFVQEIAWAQSAPKDLRRVAPPGSIRVVRVQEPEYVFEKTAGTPARGRAPATPASYDRKRAPSGQKYYLVRLKLEAAAMDESQKHMFTRRQVRLVGHERPNGLLTSRLPIAINDNDRPMMAVIIDDDKIYTPSGGSEVDFVYEVPAGFVPQFIEYKMTARANLASQKTEEVSPSDEPADTTATTTSSAPSTPSGGSNTNARSGGDRVSGVRTTRNSHFGDDLPITMTNYQSFGLDEQQGAMQSGHVYGNVADQGQGGSGAALSTFRVPAAMRLFHLEVEQLRAKSGLGRAISLAVTTAQQYKVTDNLGKEYLVAGQYAVANVGGQEVVEIQYFPLDVIGSGRGGIREFQRIQQNQLDAADAQLVYLFLVEPGVEIRGFSTGRRTTDLSDLNLVAPR